MSETGKEAQESATLYASSVAVGSDADAIVRDLVANNKLFAALQGTPNASFFVMDLTIVGQVSQHAGPKRYKLAKAGLDAALPTLISKPVHVTYALDGHADAGRPMKPIGTFLGADTIETEDGTIVRVVGTLWEGDFPDEVAAIRAQKATLGGSYEIAYATSAVTETSPGVLELGQYTFSGGAILRYDKAAHPDTRLHHASADTVITTNVTRSTSADHIAQIVIDAVKSETTASRLTDAVRAPARQVIPEVVGAQKPMAVKAAKKETSMTKYAGFDEEQARAIDSIVAEALARTEAKSETESLRTQLANAKTELAALKEASEARAQAQTEAHAKENEAAARAGAAETKLAEVEAALATAQAQLAELESVAIEVKAQSKWDELSKEFGLTHLAANEIEERMQTVRKLVAGKERVEIDEYKKVISGGRPQIVPLAAGTGGAQASTDWDVKKAFGIGKPRYR